MRAPGLGRALAALLLLGSAGCVHRHPLIAPAPLRAMAGVPVQLSSGPVPPPAGTTISWRLADGRTLEGAEVSATFAQAGTTRVVQQVRDGDGLREQPLEVEVTRRAPWMAVPPTARTGILFDRLFQRLPAWKSLLGETLGAATLGEAQQAFVEAFGIDPMDAAGARAGGFDPDEGLAVIGFGDEPGASYLAIGTADDDAARATVRKALEGQGAQFTPGPEGFEVAHTRSTHIHLRVERGYLILRMSRSEEAALHLADFAKAPDVGLESVAAFSTLRAALPAGDVWLWSSPEALADGDDLARSDGLFKQVVAGGRGALASVAHEGFEVRLQGKLLIEGEGRAGLARLFSDAQPSALAERAPAGALLYGSAHGDLPGLLKGLLGSDTAKRGEVGRALAQLANVLGRGLAFAFYSEAAESYRAWAESGEPTLKGELLLGLRMRDATAAETALRELQAAASLPGRAERVAGQLRLTTSIEGHPAGLLAEGRELSLGWGLKRFPRLVTPPPGAPTLAESLSRRLPASALMPGRWLMWLDVAGLVDHLEPDGMVPGVEPTVLLQMRLLAGLALQPLKPIRDVVATVEPVPEGLGLDVRLRLRPTAAP